jgi:hypothetical protein
MDIYNVIAFGTRKWDTEYHRSVFRGASEVSWQLDVRNHGSFSDISRQKAAAVDFLVEKYANEFNLIYNY